MIPDEMTVFRVLHRHSGYDERIAQFYDTYPTMMQLAEFCIQTDMNRPQSIFISQIIDLVESIQKLEMEEINVEKFSERMHVLLNMQPLPKWPSWVTDGLRSVQNSLHQSAAAGTPASKSPLLNLIRINSPGTVNLVQCQNVANDFFWQRIWDSDEDVVVAVERLITQGQERRIKAERGAVQLPEPMRKMFIDARERGLSCSPLRHACLAHKPGSREERLLHNALLFELG